MSKDKVQAATPTEPNPKSKKSVHVDEIDPQPNVNSSATSDVSASTEQVGASQTPDHASAARGEDAGPDVRTVLDSDETGHN